MRVKSVNGRWVTVAVALLTALAVLAGLRTLWLSFGEFDPAGDTTRLQGVWTATWDDAGAGQKASIVVDGTTWTFHNPLVGRLDNRSSYRFRVDARDPAYRVLELVEWLGPGAPQPGHQAPRSYRYELDGDALHLGGTAAKSNGLLYRRSPREKP